MCLVPLPAIDHTFQISYERTFLNAKKGLLISGGLLVTGYNNNLDIGFVEEIQFRFYLNDIRNSGKKNKFQFAFYFSPFVAHKYLRKNDTFSYYYYDYTNSVSSGFISGLKGTYSRFAIDFYIGGGFKKSVANKNHDISKGKSYDHDNYTGVFPKVGVQLGFIF